MGHIINEVSLKIREPLFFHEIPEGYHKHYTNKNYAERTHSQSGKSFFQNHFLLI